MRIVSFFLLISLLVACGKTQTTDSTVIVDKQSQANLKVLFQSMGSLEFEVVYEAGAEPYVGTRLNGKPYWELLETNVKAIFSEREGQYVLNIPKELNQMREIPDQARTGWSIDDLLQLERSYRQTVNSGSLGSVFVAFVEGYMIQDGAQNPNIIGVNIAGTTMIAVFKDVITNSASGASAKFMEQSTLVHEFGHVVGLVNGGVAMSTDHQDHEHGHHCNNDKCVMFWKNEGKGELLAFVQNFMLTGNTVMFDQNCLDDTKAYSN